jgi:hypothetical protein
MIRQTGPRVREDQGMKLWFDNVNQLITEGVDLKNKASVESLELVRQVPGIKEPIVVFRYEKPVTPAQRGKSP